ncbi:MAG: nucleoside hydrolase [Candidatus Bathyarchaeia archaeon]
MLDIIYDGDPGIDDAIAIIFILKTGGVNLRAIITVAGNVSVFKATRNVFKILSLLGEEDRVKVGVGSDKPLARPLRTAEYYHGPDGLGDTEHLFQRIGLEELMKTVSPGVELMIETIMNSPKPITIITTGPLTNLAKALSTEPRISSRVRRVVSMGGAIETPGNVTPFAEFNIYTDPEAAEQVFHSGLPLILVPLDVTTKTYLTSREIREIMDAKKTLTNFICKSVSYNMDLRPVGGEGKFYLHDPLTAGIAIDESLIREARPGHVTVECADEKTVGRTYFNEYSTIEQTPVITVIKNVYSDRFIDTLIRNLKK